MGINNALLGGVIGGIPGALIGLGMPEASDYMTGGKYNSESPSSAGYAEDIQEMKFTLSKEELLGVIKAANDRGFNKTKIEDFRVIFSGSGYEIQFGVKNEGE